MTTGNRLTDNSIMRPVLILIAAYLLGSIPFGYLIVRAKEGADVRESGSGGTGATNVSRRAGKRAGIVTLLLDATKGALAVLLARWLAGAEFGINWWVAAAAIIAVLGHCFPVWLGFRGGKGVATGVGVFLGLSPLAVAGAAVVFILVVGATRYVSLASIIAAAAFPLCIWLLSVLAPRATNFAPVMTAALASAALIIFMHRANIGRLLRGTESKFK
jgi:glycerol-3-phosphate acyltransferase PlsY